MSDAISKALVRLQKSAHDLNEITDTAGRTIKEVELFLAECNVGVTAAALFEPGSDPECEGYLEYRRVGKNHRIAVVYGCVPEDESVTPWANCSRDEKLKSFAKLPELLNKIAERVDDQIEAVKQTVEVVSSSILNVTANGGAK